MRTGYLNGFTRFEITITTPRWGTFRDCFWARTQTAALAAARRKWTSATAITLE